MNLTGPLLMIVPEFLLISGLALTLFLGCYGAVRLCHLADRWVLGSIAALVGAFCLVRIVLAFVNQPAQGVYNWAVVGDMLGLMAVVSAVYGFSQWTMRGVYRVIKPQTGSRVRAAARGLWRFLRARHAWLGWIVLTTATLHVLFYLPLLARQPWPRAIAEPAVVTGAGAWVILAGLVGLGLGIAAVLRHKRTVRLIRTVHIVAAAGFFVVTLIHVGTKLAMRY